MDPGPPEPRTVSIPYAEEAAAEIAMIKAVVAREIPKVSDVCYEPRLTDAPTFQGAWLIELTVSTTGAPKDVVITAKEAPDAAMERCLADQAALWTFDPIRAAQPIKKTLTFRPKP